MTTKKNKNCWGRGKNEGRRLTGSLEKKQNGAGLEGVLALARKKSRWCAATRRKTRKRKCRIVKHSVFESLITDSREKTGSKKGTRGKKEFVQERKTIVSYGVSNRGRQRNIYQKTTRK